MTRRITVLTEDAPLGELLQDRFQDMGYEVLSRPAAGRPDLVIRDGGTGALPPSLAGVPVVLLLAKGGKADPRAAACLARPMDFEDLAATVEALLEAAADPMNQKLEDAPRIEPFPAEASRAEKGRKLRMVRWGVRVLALNAHACLLAVPEDFRTEGPITLWMPVRGTVRPLRLPAEVESLRREDAQILATCRFEALEPVEAAELKRILDDRRSRFRG